MPEESLEKHEVLTDNETVREGQASEYKLVPVSESIRYRKRAQVAEMKLAELEEAYQKQTGQLGTLQEQMASIQLEQQLAEQLGKAQTVDMETAMLVVRERLGDEAVDGDDLRGRLEDVIERVRQEKPFLFGEVSSVDHPQGETQMNQGLKEGRVESASKTQGVKEVRSGNPNRVLQQAAEAAVQSGSRSDVQEYLRIRRQVF